MGGHAEVEKRESRKHDAKKRAENGKSSVQAAEDEGR